MTADDRTQTPAGHGAKTAAVREQAILALLSAPSIAQAATRCQIGEKTLRRWLAEDTFKAEYEAARHATFQAAVRRLPALTGRAVDTLAALLGTATHPAVRLGAARSIAEFAQHQFDAETILRKLEALEASSQRR